MMATDKTNSRKLGRDEMLDAEEIIDRFKPLRRFLQDNWGRIGLRLLRARRPEDIRMALKSVPQVEWCVIFRDHPTVCLLREGRAKVNWRQVRRTRNRCIEARLESDRLCSEYQEAHRKADDANKALQDYTSQFAGSKRSRRHLLAIRNIEKQLQVQELTDRENELRASVGVAQEKKDKLEKLLSRQEAAFARSELLRFTRNKRFDKNLLNFAKAMVGLPEYGWLHSFRKSSRILDGREDLRAEKRTNYQLFELIEMIVKKSKRINLRKIEARLQKELLRKETDLFLKGHVCPNWAYVHQSFEECRGKGHRRGDIHFKIMERIIHHFERPKTSTEMELAKRKQLVYS